MDIKKENTEGLTCSIEAIIPAKTVESEVDLRLAKKGEDVALPGFRKGKAPLNILRKRYGQQVMGDVVNDVISDAISTYVKDKKIKMAGTPSVEVSSYDENKGLAFAAVIESLPVLKLPKVEGLELSRLNVSDTKSRVAEALESLAAQHTQEVDLKKERPAKNKDQVIIDFEGFLDGKPFDGGKAEGFKLTLGSGSFIPGFEDQIVGKKKGDTFDVNVTFPKEYHEPKLAGKPTVFKIKLHDIKELEPAKVSDEFAKTLGLKDKAALEQEMEKRLEQEGNATTRRHLKRQVLTFIASQLDQDVPKKMLERELDAIWNEYKQQKQQDTSLEDVTEETFKKEHVNLARRRILLGLALAEIGSQKKVKLDPVLMRQEAMRYAQQYRGQEQQVFDYLTQNKEVFMEFQAPFYEDKVVDAILEMAKFKDKDIKLKDLLQEIEKLEEEALKILDDGKKDSSKAEKPSKKPADKKAAAKKD